MELPPDWNAFIASLCSNGVRFLVVGAHALAAHGRPRATQDLDILVEPTEENAKRLGIALREFGFPALANEASAFAKRNRMATLGREPLRIDVMTSISGVSFRSAWQNRVIVRFGDHEVGVLGKVELARNKLASGRTKDLLDIALLRELDGEAPPKAVSKTRRRSSPRKK